MRLTQHPEYQRVYLNNGETALRCQQAIKLWRVNNDVIAVPAYALDWTYESALLFVSSLSQLFQAYNDILWNNFHYCRQCGGQCCVVDASNVRAFDMLAIALLDLPTPVLADTITAKERECIYLSNHRCTWPDKWRTIKCWSFYCLGVGPCKPGDSIGKLYAAITTKLQQVVRSHLPDQLLRYETVQGVSLTHYLDDPVRFSDELHNALVEIFVGPFSKVYPIFNEESVSSQSINLSEVSENTIDDVLASIAEIAEQVYESPLTILQEFGISPEQVLADLESLQWIIEGHPANEQKLLKEMYSRYAYLPDSSESDTFAICYSISELIFKLSNVLIISGRA